MKKHCELPHVQKHEDITEHLDQVTVFLEDMQKEVSTNLRNTSSARLAKQTMKNLETIGAIIAHVKQTKS